MGMRRRKDEDSTGEARAEVVECGDGGRGWGGRWR